MSLLPPLCPVVGKAPTLVSRPRQKSPTISQQTLYSLLKKRHERYLAHRDSVATLHAACNFAVEQQRSSPQEMRTDTNLLSRLDHVVHRAKVRLKRKYSGRRTHSHVPGEQNALEVHSAKANLCPPAAVKGNYNAVFGHGGKSRHLHRTTKSKSANVITTTNKDKYQCVDFKLPSLPVKSSLTATGVATNFVSLEGRIRTETVHSKPEQLYKHDEMVISVEPKPLVVFLSEQHSNTPKATGIPNAPPTTPAGMYSQSYKFIPALHDVKSQRLLKNRLEEIIEKLKEKSLQGSQVASNEERKQKEAIAKLKTKQRAEIYALNKIMEEYEEQKFQAFLSAKV